METSMEYKIAFLDSDSMISCSFSGGSGFAWWYFLIFHLKVSCL